MLTGKWLLFSVANLFWLINGWLISNLGVAQEDERLRFPPEPAGFAEARKRLMEQIPKSSYRFQVPARIEGGGLPIQVEPPGYACPTMVDLDGDGRSDLLVGQMNGGNILYFRNLGEEDGRPVFAAGEWLMVGDQRLSVPGVSCCTSATPQLVDWNHNGQLDLIAGNYSTDRQPQGNLWWFEGSEPQPGETASQFSAPRLITDSVGQPLQTANFAREFDFPQSILDGLCLHPHVVDFDGDGDLDLMVGTNGGRFFYFENLGNRPTPGFKATPQLLTIALPIARSAPVLIDWDGDGKLDLISGASNGGVYLSINAGEKGMPQWTEWVELIPPPLDELTATWEEISNQPAQRSGDSSRVWVYDFNQDGLLDLLVGDCRQGYQAKPGISTELFWEKEKQFEQRTQKLEAIRSRLLMQIRQLEIDEHLTTEKRKANEDKNQLEQQLTEIAEQVRRHHLEREEWGVRVQTGHVWVYLQMPKSVDNR